MAVAGLAVAVRRPDAPYQDAWKAAVATCALVAVYIGATQGNDDDNNDE